MESSGHTDSPQSGAALRNRVNLTNPRISQLQLPAKGKQVFLWDSNTIQLGVRATSGAKAFIFQSRLKSGESIRITIGKCSDRTIEDARIRARELQGLIDDGLDPRVVIADKILEQANARAKRESVKLMEFNQQLTFGEVWQEYVTYRSSSHGELSAWSKRSIQDHIDIASLGGIKRKRAAGYTEAGVLAPLLKMRLRDVTQSYVQSLMARENKVRPTRAALAFRLLRAFIRWAYDQPQYKELVHIDAVAPSIAKKAVRKVKAKENDCLQREQLASWFKAIRELSNPIQSAYLQALLLTGARRNELMALKWSDVDFQWNTITIHDKVEGERIIPLTPYLSHLFKSLPKANKWVFSANSKEGYLNEPRAAHVRALELAGLPHVSIHGLRRSFGTLSEWCEAPVGVVAQIMGHKPSAIAEKHYRRRPIDLLRTWHSKIEAWILEQAGIKQPEADAPLLRVVNSES